MSKLDWQESLADSNARGSDEVNDLAEEIISEPEFNPFHPRNIIVAIYEDCLFQSDGTTQGEFRIAELMEKREIHNLGRFVYGRIIEYWEKRAMEEAENRLANSWGDEK